MKISCALDRFLLSLKGAKAETTRRWYERKLRPLVSFLGNVDVGSVDVQALRRWRASLQDVQERYTTHPTRGAVDGGFSPWTLHGYIRAARRFFRWLGEEGVVQSNPAQRLELPRLPKVGYKGIDDDDMAKMLRAAQGNPRDLALVFFLASTACRVAGAAGLKVGDLLLKRGRAVVREKGEKERLVYLAPAAVEAMQAWLAVRPKDRGEHVFVGLKGGLRTSGIYQLLKRLAKAAKVARGWNPHNWRHGTARRLLVSGASLAHVSQVLGHSSIEVTSSHYGIFADRELKRAHSRHVSLPELEVE